MTKYSGIPQTLRYTVCQCLKVTYFTTHKDKVVFWAWCVGIFFSDRFVESYAEYARKEEVERSASSCMVAYFFDNPVHI